MRIQRSPDGNALLVVVGGNGTADSPFDWQAVSLALVDRWDCCNTA